MTLNEAIRMAERRCKMLRHRIEYNRAHGIGYSWDQSEIKAWQTLIRAAKRIESDDDGGQVNVRGDARRPF